MPSCQFREKPGSAEVCPKLAGAGEMFCPRHKAIEQLRSSGNDERLRARELQQRLDRTVVTKMPETRRGLIEQGYQYVGNDICACGHPIEWWRSPNQRKVPYEPMKDASSEAKSHFAYCKRAYESKSTMIGGTRWPRRRAA